MDDTDIIATDRKCNNPHLYQNNNYQDNNYQENQGNYQNNQQNYPINGQNNIPQNFQPNNNYQQNNNFQQNSNYQQNNVPENTNYGSRAPQEQIPIDKSIDYDQPDQVEEKLPQKPVESNVLVEDESVDSRPTLSSEIQAQTSKIVENNVVTEVVPKLETEQSSKNEA